MEISFDSIELRALCEDEDLARQELGSTVSHLLKNRLADIDSATCVGDLVAGRPRFEDHGAGRIVLELAEGFILAFTPNQRRLPVTSSGALDWGRVGRVKLVAIERNHG